MVIEQLTFRSARALAEQLSNKHKQTAYIVKTETGYIVTCNPYYDDNVISEVGVANYFENNLTMPESVVYFR